LDIPRLRAPGLSDANLLHAIILAEEAGRSLASVPVLEALVVQRLLTQLDVRKDVWVAKGGAGQPVISLALHDILLERNQLLGSGAVADAIVCLEGETLWLWRNLTREATPTHGSIPACPLSSISVGDRMRIGGPDAAHLFRAAVEEWRLLNAAQVAAAGLRAVEIASDYAREREAFGRRIGEFQGVAHPLADAFTDLDGARLLCWRAADAIACDEPQAGALVSMAAWWAGVSGRRATIRAMRTFGGYGMTMEYDPQLYFRRINAWSLASGSPDAALDEIAARLWGGRVTNLPETGALGIDFGWGDEGEAAAQRMGAFCKRRHDAQMRQFMRDSLDGFDLSLQQELAAEGLLYPDAPSEYGGPGQSAIAAAATRDVCGDYYWNLLAPNVTDMIAKIILHFGSEEARREILRKIYSGAAYCTLAYSEPSCGSDIFAARTTATRDGDGWLINGQKMFTSTAHLADYALMVTRTGIDKHRGITMFVVPLRQKGFSLTEIKTIGNERTNVTFYNDVRVPDTYRIGPVDGGAKVLAEALAIEQSSGDLHVMSLKSLLSNTLEWARDTGAGPAPIERAEVRRALAETATRLAVQDTLNRRTIWAYGAGEARKHFGPMAKLFGSESWVACSARLLEVAAPASLTIQRRAEGAIEFLLRRAIPSTIYAGSSEVQRSLIAEAGLGLPRSR
jgi:alkylation response protein AidB-like acyl-CoA dehydrogenase